MKAVTSRRPRRSEVASDRGSPAGWPGSSPESSRFLSVSLVGLLMVEPGAGSAPGLQRVEKFVFVQLQIIVSSSDV